MSRHDPDIVYKKVKTDDGYEYVSMGFDSLGCFNDGAYIVIADSQCTNYRPVTSTSIRFNDRAVELYVAMESFKQELVHEIIVTLNTSKSLDESISQALENFAKKRNIIDYGADDVSLPEYAI